MRLVIDKPGVYTIAAAKYHDDPAPQPSLSSSLARTLLQRSPAHAKAEHPRLAPELVREEKREFDIGTAGHGLMLGDQTTRITVIPFDDYRKKAAQEARDACYAAGETPILAHQFDDLQAMVAAGRAQVAAHAEASFLFGKTGKCEQTLIWQERNGVWCRARVDWRTHAGAIHGDYKTTGASAEPDAWTRYLFGEGLDVQAAWYRRGEAAITGSKPRFLFCVQEVKPPYALSVLELLPQALAEAEEKIEHAIELWGQCLKADRWPGYPGRICYVDRPGWDRVKHEERQLRRADDRKHGADKLAHMLSWQAP